MVTCALMTSLDLKPTPPACGMSLSLRNPRPRSTHVVEAELDAAEDEYKYSLQVICMTLDSSSSPVRMSADEAAAGSDDDDDAADDPGATNSTPHPPPLNTLLPPPSNVVGALVACSSAAA